MIGADEQVEIADNHLYYHVYARDACANGDDPSPTPLPIHVPNKPVVTANTPTPLASPNPHHVRVNDTHFVIIDWQAIQEPRPVRGQQVILLPQEGLDYPYWSNTYTEWFSWFNISCPPGWLCPLSKTGNLWQCWIDENFRPFCHAVANKFRPGSTIRLPTGSLHGGLHLHYEGDLGTNMLINATCEVAAPHNTISIINSEVNYVPSGNRGEWRFDARSGYVCPQAFEYPTPPSVARPAIPAAASQTATIGDFVAGQHVGLNLKKFAYLQGQVILGYDIHYHKAEIHYSPWDLIGCPDGKNCGTYRGDQANVWKCLDQGFANCFPVGDKRYGLTMGHINTSNALSGITALYAGGANGYSIQFDFQCNESVPFGEVHFNVLGQENVTHAITVWAHTHEVCPDREWGQIRGGSVFLLIVFTLFIGYFVIGTIVLYVANGTVALPNEGFWDEFGSSLAAGVGCIFSCGKGASAGTGNYDAI
jgi:hypothetical protein